MICVSITIMIVNSSVKSSFHCKYYVAEISLIIYFLIAINSPPRCAGHSICLQRVYILVILRRLADMSPIDVAYSSCGIRIICPCLCLSTRYFDEIVSFPVVSHEPPRTQLLVS